MPVNTAMSTSPGTERPTTTHACPQAARSGSRTVPATCMSPATRRSAASSSANGRRWTCPWWRTCRPTTCRDPFPGTGSISSTAGSRKISVLRAWRWSSCASPSWKKPTGTSAATCATTSRHPSSPCSTRRRCSPSTCSARCSGGCGTRAAFPKWRPAQRQRPLFSTTPSTKAGTSTGAPWMWRPVHT